MADQYYIHRDGSRYGPMSWRSLQEGTTNGRVQPTDLVWGPEMQEWTPAKKVTGLFEGAKTTISTPPPLSASKKPQPQRLVASRFTCPLCGSAKNMGDKSKELYDSRVCKKCSNSFVNRRQFAFFIDYVLVPIFIVVAVLFSLQIIKAASLGSGVTNNLTKIVCLVALIAVVMQFFVREFYHGLSIGKLICGLQVLNATTTQYPSLFSTLKRGVAGTFIFMLCLLCFAAGLIPGAIAIYFINKKLRSGPRRGDKRANTKVIWKKYRDKAPFSSKVLYDFKKTGLVREILVSAVLFMIIVALIANIIMKRNTSLLTIGKTTSNTPTIAQNEEKRGSVQRERDEIERLAMKTLDEMTSLGNNYEQELDVIGWESIFDHKRISKDKALKESKAILKKAKAISGKYRIEQAQLVDKYLEGVKSLKINAHSKRQILDGFDVSKSKAAWNKSWDAEDNILLEVSNIFSLLSKRRGKWQVEPEGTILFYSDDDFEIFNSYLKNIEGAGKQQEILNKNAGNEMFMSLIKAEEQL